MPVIECSCGMVMSVAARDPRACCIRCGGVEFHILERREVVSESSERRGDLSATGGCTARRLALTGIATAAGRCAELRSHI